MPFPHCRISGKRAKNLSAFGFKEFVICLGCKGFVIKEYFYNYWLRQSDVTIKNSPAGADITIHKSSTEDWEGTLAGTGIDVQKGLRKNSALYTNF